MQPVHSSLRQAETLAVLKAYFDESGLHGDAGVFVLAGYIAPEQEWNSVEKLWKAALEKPRVSPPLGYFHAVDVEGRGSGPFRRLTQTERESLKIDAVNAIVGSGVIGVASGVLLDAYDNLVKGKAHDAIGGPYILCFQHVLLQAAELSKMFLGEDDGEDIAYIFDQHPRLAKLAREIYAKLIEDGKQESYRLGKLTFADKRKFWPLQAADHIAYETRKYMVGERSRPAMNRFMSWRQHHGEYFDQRGISQLLGEMRQNGKL